MSMYLTYLFLSGVACLPAHQDPVFRGMYHGTRKHEDDLADVLARAKFNGVEKIIVTGGSLEDSRAALSLTKSDSLMYCTVGCHPTRCTEFEGNPEDYFQGLLALATDNLDKVVAIGECGLDYDRLEFCSKEIQKKYFELQIGIADHTKRPMFLHCRNAASDLVEILSKNRHRFTTGVVHSFDGSHEDLKAILDMGLFIGINGCSLKTESNLTVVQSIPTDRIMLETDCPWCEVRPTHASFKHLKTRISSRKKEKWEKDFQVKGRNEPCNIVQVLEVLSALKGEDEGKLAELVYENTSKMFFPQ